MQGHPHLHNLPNFQRELLRLAGEDGVESCVALAMEVVASAVHELEVTGQRLRSFLGRQFGRRSEKIMPGQPLFDFMLGLFEGGVGAAAGNNDNRSNPNADSVASHADGSDADVSEPDADALSTDESASEDGPSRPNPKPRRRSDRGSIFDLPLPRRVEDVLVPDEARICECGCACVTTKFRNVATIEVEPAKAHLRVQRVEEVGCPRCSGGVARAEPTGIVEPGCRAGTSLIAHLVTTKVADACPVYRQRSILGRGGLELADSTADEYFAAGGHLAEPISNFLQQQTLASQLASTDDTRLLALGKTSKGGPTKGRLWCVIGDLDVVGFCRFTIDWKQSSFAEIIKGFQGVLQGDGYAGYRSYAGAHQGIVLAGCMDHCRRKFVAAARQGDIRAGPVLTLMAQLYKIERGLGKRQADPAERLVCRQRHSVPILAQLKTEIQRLAAETRPRTLMADATGYAENQWTELCAFTNDGRIPISNVHVEQKLKDVALLRKNSLFAGSVAGAHRLAHLLTLVLNCRLAGVCPFTYLCDVFARMVDGWPSTRIGELTPRAWALTQ